MHDSPHQGQSDLLYSQESLFRECVIIKMFLLLYIKTAETVKLPSEAIFKSYGVRFHFGRMVLHIKQMALTKTHNVFIKLITHAAIHIFCGVSAGTALHE